MGTVYNRGSRSKPNWYVAYKDQDGKRRAVASKQPTKEQARRFLAQIEANIAAGQVGIVQPSVEPMCAPLMTEWLAGLRNRNADHDRGVAHNHLIPPFGDLRIMAIDLPRLMRWIDGQRAAGCAEASIRQRLGLLSRFFGWMIERGLATVNPVRLIPAGKRPRPSQKQDIPWIQEDSVVRRILELLPEPVCYLFYLGNRSGIRPGELVSLRLSDFDDLANGVIRVRFSNDGPLKEDKDGTGKIKWVPAADDCAEYLGPWLARRRTETDDVESHVFPAPTNARKYYKPNTINHHWNAVRNQLGLDLTWYQATRHSFTSRLVAAGVPINEVADALGHSSPTITRQYYDHYVRRSYSGQVRGGLGLGASSTPDTTPPAAGRPLQVIGVLGDIHSEDARLACAIKYLRESGCDRILAVGDIVDGPGDFVRTCALLDAPDIDAVRGNHERWLLGGTMRDLPDALPTNALGDRERHFLAGLPVVREYATSAGRALLCHGLGLDDMAGLKPDDDPQDNIALQALRAAACYRLVFAGHTHRRMVRQVGGLTIINPGTLYREHQPGFARIDLVAGEVAFFDLVERGDGIAVEASERIAIVV